MHGSYHSDTNISYCSILRSQAQLRYNRIVNWLGEVINEFGKRVHTYAICTVFIDDDSFGECFIPRFNLKGSFSPVQCISLDTIKIIDTGHLQKEEKSQMISLRSGNLGWSKIYSYYSMKNCNRCWKHKEMEREIKWRKRANWFVNNEWENVYFFIWTFHGERFSDTWRTNTNKWIKEHWHKLRTFFNK